MVSQRGPCELAEPAAADSVEVRSTVGCVRIECHVERPSWMQSVQMMQTRTTTGIPYRGQVSFPPSGISSSPATRSAAATPGNLILHSELHSWGRTTARPSRPEN